MDPEQERILAGYARAEHQLRDWLAHSSPVDLRGPSNGTRWSNEELLFHMVFGYMVVRALLPLVRVLGRLPRPWARAFANTLNTATAPFDAINYWGSKAAATVYNRHRMAEKLHRVATAAEHRLERERAESLALSMPFPTRWDPFFTPDMTLAQVYAYPTMHFDFHSRQLDLPPAPAPDPR